MKWTVSDCISCGFKTNNSSLCITLQKVLIEEDITSITDVGWLLFIWLCSHQPIKQQPSQRTDTELLFTAPAMMNSRSRLKQCFICSYDKSFYTSLSWTISATALWYAALLLSAWLAEEPVCVFYVPQWEHIGRPLLLVSAAREKTCLQYRVTELGCRQRHAGNIIVLPLWEQLC